MMEHEDAGTIAAHSAVPALPKIRWTHILSISIFWLALNFHWAALAIIILPSQVYKIVGNADKGVALAFVLVPGAFVSLFANPLFGTLSDRTRGWLANWGRRRPYIFVGTLVNIAAMAWMAASRDIVSLAIAYILVQFSSNAAQAPFHALLPDIVPEEQRGLASGVMGLLSIAGTVAGVTVASLFVVSNLPMPDYTRGLWIAYGTIIAVLLGLMLITVFSVYQDKGTLLQPTGQQRVPWYKRFSRSTILNVLGTVVVTALAWLLMTLWNSIQGPGLHISSDAQELILELIATVGLLRLFDFHPRRDPDFAWVLATRLVMMLGIYTIQTYFQYYMRDAVGVPDPEAQSRNFVIIVSLTSLVSAFAAGWLSDRFGRKRLVYISGFFMALVGFVFVIFHSLLIVLLAGAIFGIAYGAYQSVDWALVADVLPSAKHYARDMGVWNISLSLPQVIAPVIGGPIIDHFNNSGNPILGYQVIFVMAIVYCLLGTVTVRFIKGVKR